MMSIRTERYVNNFSVNVPAAVAGVPGQNDIFTLIVPTKAKFRLKGFGNYTGTLAAWSFIWWVFMENGFVKFPYDAILDQLGYGPQRQEMKEIECAGGSTVIVRGFNNTAGIVAMGISIEYEFEYQE